MTQPAASQKYTPNRLTRMLWYCSGADGELLAACPNSDRVKFEGIGGVVLATAVLAFTSGSYAFYTVFAPKSETALTSETHWPTVGLALVLGTIWAAVIFNLDRFIVSSTGKGDGTEAITAGELVKGLPRLVMAIIIGVCISKPLEIRILKPEIDAQLELEQNEYLAKLNTLAEQSVEGRKQELRGKIEVAQKRLDESRDHFEKRRLEIRDQRGKLELEAEGKTGSGVAGRGPAWRDKKENLDKMEAELNADREGNTKANKSVEDDIQTWRAELNQLDDRWRSTRESNARQARHLDGLMRRIQISHDIGGQIPIWIMLLLLAIETGPIFFKMMMTRGAYDYLEENRKLLLLASQGVEPESYIYVDGNGGVEARADRFHKVDSVLAEARRERRDENELSEAVHQRFREQKTQELDEKGIAEFIQPKTSDTKG